MTKILKRSPHYGQHVAHGAKGFIDFAGWEMPVAYGSSVEEHLAGRRQAAVSPVTSVPALVAHTLGT